jgi:hypothetical protein
MPETGYGSEEFLRACRLAAACRQIEGTSLRAKWRRLRGSAPLARYHRRLPVIELRLTDSASGRMIGEHFAFRTGGRYRYRTAQGVLPLPEVFADFMRGRHRQALRTNVGHARRAGFVVHCYAVDNWFPGTTDDRRHAISPGPIERWLVTAADGTCVGDSILSVDSDVALLHGLVSFAPYARWLLHAAIIERLCGEARLLLINSEPAYLLTPGNQHFQRLLGFQISRLAIRETLDPAPVQPAQPAGLCWPPDEPSTCGIATSRVSDEEPVLAA